MRLDLTNHRDTPCEAVTGLAVEAGRPAPARLNLCFTLVGVVSSIAVAPAGPARRADGLWRHTCFEAFVRAGEAKEYLELNFAPSLEWAAYRFAGYRAGMAPANEIEPRPVVRTSGKDSLVVDVALDLPPAMALEPWRLALCAVIEEAGGRLSYWALAHPRGKPDFHHVDGFVLDL